MPHENAVKSAILRPWKRITFKKILTLTWQWSLPKWRSLLSMIPWKVIIYYGGCKSVSYNQKHIISWRFWPLPASSQVISKHLYSHLLHQKTVPLTILNFSTKTVDSVFYIHLFTDSPSGSKRCQTSVDMSLMASQFATVTMEKFHK